MINKTDDDQKDDWNDAKRSINNTKEENEKLVRCHIGCCCYNYRKQKNRFNVPIKDDCTLTTVNVI